MIIEVANVDNVPTWIEHENGKRERIRDTIELFGNI
jgi:hypothetical protein